MKSTKMDLSAKNYRDVFGIRENHGKVNRFVKAVIINEGDDRGDIIVANDNYGTNRKYANFTEGKKAAGLPPTYIAFPGVETAIMCKQKYIGPDDKIHVFGEEAEAEANYKKGMDMLAELCQDMMEDGIESIKHTETGSIRVINNEEAIVEKPNTSWIINFERQVEQTQVDRNLFYKTVRRLCIHFKHDNLDVVTWRSQP